MSLGLRRNQPGLQTIGATVGVYSVEERAEKLLQVPVKSWALRVIFLHWEASPDLVEYNSRPVVLAGHEEKVVLLSWASKVLLPLFVRVQDVGPMVGSRHWNRPSGARKHALLKSSRRTF